jgi:hypothetical protein
MPILDLPPALHAGPLRGSHLHLEAMRAGNGGIGEKSAEADPDRPAPVEATAVEATAIEAMAVIAWRGTHPRRRYVIEHPLISSALVARTS